MPKQDMCPICTKAFKKGDVVAKYRIWGDDKKTLAHLRCAMILATPAKEPSKQK